VPDNELLVIVNLAAHETIVDVPLESRGSGVSAPFEVVDLVNGRVAHVFSCDQALVGSRKGA
jgi:hypothetical protein